MTTQEIANKLVEYCRKAEYTKALEELYDENAVSIEPEGASSMPRAQGMDAIKKKGEEWGNMVEEVHGNEVSNPLIAGNFFTVTMKNDVTFKGMGRMTMEEVCVYEVNNGKVVTEQFFYPPMPAG